MARGWTRRELLLDAGTVTLGALVLGVAGCRATGSDGTGGGSASPGGAGEASVPPTPQAGATATTGPPGDPSGEDGATASNGTWERVDLGFVSAYVLVRGGQATLVDTGIGGSGDAIGTVLEAAGSRWEDLGDVILTHRHPDHAGSIAEVAERAPGATISIGAGDLDAVSGIVDATAVEDGATVAGLRIVGTPGHTPGHIAVHDGTLGVLLTGDAINGTDAGGEVTGPNPRFTEDMEAAVASVRTLAGLTYDTVLFGHGEPVTADGTAKVATLAGTLGA